MRTYFFSDCDGSPREVVTPTDLKEADKEIGDMFPGYTVHDVPSDGNCLFSALAHQLNLPLHQASTVRKDLVNYLRSHHSEMVRYQEKYATVKIQ